MKVIKMPPPQRRIEYRYTTTRVERRIIAPDGAVLAIDWFHRGPADPTPSKDKSRGERLLRAVAA
jgi:hypothetical protein